MPKFESGQEGRARRIAGLVEATGSFNSWQVQRAGLCFAAVRPTKRMHDKSRVPPKRSGSFCQPTRSPSGSELLARFDLLEVLTVGGAIR